MVTFENILLPEELKQCYDNAKANNLLPMNFEDYIVKSARNYIIMRLPKFLSNIFQTGIIREVIRVINGEGILNFQGEIKNIYEFIDNDTPIEDLNTLSFTQNTPINFTLNNSSTKYVIVEYSFNEEDDEAFLFLFQNIAVYYMALHWSMLNNVDKLNLSVDINYFKNIVDNILDDIKNKKAFLEVQQKCNLYETFGEQGIITLYIKRIE